MTREQFKQLLKTDREQALKLVIKASVDEWLNEGPEEVVRVLMIWVTEEPPIHMHDSDEAILEYADNRQMFDSETWSCDECGKSIPDDEESLVNSHHAESCSLNPKNVVG